MSIRAVVWTAISLSAASCGFNPVGQTTQGNCTSGTGTIVLENTADEAVSVALSGSDGSGSAVMVAAHAVSVVDDPIGSYTLTATGMTSSDTLLSQSLVVLCNVPQEVVVPSGAAATLSISLFGSGAGHVDAAAAGIACSTDDEGSASCVTAVVPNTSVTLVASADAGNVFSGWTGACTGSAVSGASCTVDVGSDVTATASFNPILATSETMNITIAGTGTGTVTVDPGASMCSSGTCTADFDSGTTVTLVATSGANSVFTAWSGGTCSGGSASCTTSITSTENVTATFALASETLFVGTTGSGGVAGASGGINCTNNTGTCTDASLTFNQMVTLTATAATNWALSSWTGCTTSSGNTCNVTMSSSKGVVATFTQGTPTLTVSKMGSTGTGTVAGGPISCGSTCSGTVGAGTMVTLTAIPDTGSTVSSWSGGGCPATGTTCTTTVTAATTIVVVFGLQNETVNVALEGGTGGESVTAPVGGLNCPGTCSITEPYNTSVTLTAHSSNSTFLGWAGAGTGGGCGSAGTCTVTLDTTENVTALFQPNSELLTVHFAGSGGGTVTSADGALDCDAEPCSVDELYDTGVVLTAAPDGSSSFTSWTGCTTTTSNTCNVTLTSAKAVTATFGSGS